MATTPNNEEERWLPIPSAEGYEASSLACHRARSYVVHHELPMSALKEVADSYYEAIIKGDK